ncbi:hypothetical protein PHYSODRAFT_467715, partial [Phytophthora sojae]
CPGSKCMAAALTNSLLIAVRVTLSGVTKTVSALQPLEPSLLTLRELIKSINS